MISTKRKIILNLKNSFGKRTKRKIVVFGVDDYGNIMLHSKKARQNLVDAGLNLDFNRFTRYDCLENADDLNQLFESLTLTKDSSGRHPVFTVFAMPANINFEKILSKGDGKYYYELLPETFSKLPGYEGVWDLWKEGMSNGLLVPQFHGREHLNVNLFETLLQNNDNFLMANLREYSYVGLIGRIPSNVGYTEAFSFDELKETESHKEIISDGFNVFEKVFGFRPGHFNAPGAREHSGLEKSILESGAYIMDTDIIKNEHQGHQKYKKKFYTFGEGSSVGMTYIYRNCVFEPLLSHDAVNECLYEIKTAFKWGKPAYISSHRVNFVGGINENIRDSGLKQLRELLKKVEAIWPDVEFKTTVEMTEMLLNEK
ncbi:MAG: hypothetical protein IPM42_10335 [Saprospiraceae bacterium]|nr:hypothetical protein [Saprospiraceae bacterium]